MLNLLMIIWLILCILYIYYQPMTTDSKKEKSDKKRKQQILKWFLLIVTIYIIYVYYNNKYSGDMDVAYENIKTLRSSEVCKACDGTMSALKDTEYYKNIPIPSDDRERGIVNALAKGCNVCVNTCNRFKKRVKDVLNKNIGTDSKVYNNAKKELTILNKLCDKYNREYDELKLLNDFSKI